MSQSLPRPEDLDRYTPAMRQFLEIKLQYPDVLVLYRMGDFYETFFEDAVRANRLIGITLTKRGKDPDGNPIMMAGVPMVSLDQYVARLVKLGESVVIVEQFGTPGKTTMRRRVSRIVTPGTLTDTALLSEKSNASLLALTPPTKARPFWGLAWLTLSNGQFCGASVTDDVLEHWIARIAPAEILVSESQKTRLRERFRPTVVTPLPNWHFDAKRGEEELKKRFRLDHIDAWGIGPRRRILSSANALLDYAQETQVDLLPFILPLQVEEESAFLAIDPATRRNLEISTSTTGETNAPTLLKTLDHCATGMGSRMLRQWLHSPLRDAQKACARQRKIAALLAREELHAPMRDILGDLPDLERIITRVVMKNVRPRELASLRDSILPIAKLVQIMEPVARLHELCTSMQKIDVALYRRLMRLLLEEPAALLRDGDVLRNEADPQLQELRELRDHSEAFLAQLEEREKEATGISTLRVEYNRVAGFFISVSKGQADQVPAHYQRRQTLKNCERFITPRLKSYEDKVLSASERANALERQLYEDLLVEIRPYMRPFMRVAQAIARLDVFMSMAHHARRFRWCAPTLTQTAGIFIEKGRHPVVETLIDEYVPSDCRLHDGRRCLMITGPNMGGKSTYMRSVALIVLLAWAGFYVPAQSAQIGPIDRILTRIGASDDLARGRSTFMVEMTEAAAILHQATDQSLVLMDEIGRGTATFDGLSLAMAIAQELVQNIRAYTLFATHYFELTDLAHRLEEIANVHVHAIQSQNRIVFLHAIRDGPASQSFGIAVARLAGIPQRVVRRAQNVLKKLESQHQDAPQQLSLAMGVATPERTVQEVGLTRRQEEQLKVLEQLQALDVDSLSPREALRTLYQLKKNLFS